MKRQTLNYILILILRTSYRFFIILISLFDPYFSRNEREAIKRAFLVVEEITGTFHASEVT